MQKVIGGAMPGAVDGAGALVASADRDPILRLENG
jgi:hypothetical protein